MKKITVKMNKETYQQFHSLMNSIELGYSENEIQRQLGMVFYLWHTEKEENEILLCCDKEN